MTLSIAVTILKAVAGPSHPHPRPPHLFQGTRKPRTPPHTSPPAHFPIRVNNYSPTKPTGVSLFATNGVRRSNNTTVLGKGSAQFSVGGWMRIASGRGLSSAPGKWAGGEGTDGCVGGPAARQKQQEPPSVMGFVHHTENGHGEGGGGGGAGDGSVKQSPLPAPVKEASKLLTIPTVLTLARVAAVPLLVITFYMDSRWATTATTGIFIGAAITDWLDGYIARKMRLGTPFGAFLDPVADKLMVAATLVLLCTKSLEIAVFGQVPWLLTIPSIAIIGREITMSAVREWAASRSSRVLEAVAVNNLGKWKTATQMTALTILLASRDSSSLTGPGILVASGVVLLYISAVLAILSLAVYMRNIWRILLK